MFKMTQLTGNYHPSLWLEGLCSYSLFVYVYSWVCTCMHAWAHGSLAIPDVFPSHFLLIFLGRTLTEPGAHWSARLVINQTLGILPSLIMAVGHQALLFMMVLGSTLRSFMDWAISLASPVSLWLKNLCPFNPGSHCVDSATQLSSRYPMKSPSFVLSCLVCTREIVAHYIMQASCGVNTTGPCRHTQPLLSHN